MKGGGVVSGRGVVLTLLAVEDDLRGTVDVVVTGSKVEQRIISVPIFRRFGAFSENFSRGSAEKLKGRVQLNKVKFIKD